LLYVADKFTNVFVGQVSLQMATMASRGGWAGWLATGCYCDVSLRVVDVLNMKTVGNIYITAARVVPLA